jgi:GDP/UDP-N,N'-diacetylbacillosamine 2-epimerase (hydrolysing)
MTFKVCIVTGTRADYGLLKHVINEIDQDEALQLQLIVTGMHLSPEFGLTYQEIEKDGFHIDEKVEILLSSDTAVGINKSIGLGVIGMGEAISRLKPDLMLILGDRYEILAASIAALISSVPVAHLHGGETTLGAYDESIRHAITKMSKLHFVAAEDYRNRVIQMGENPKNVFNVGGLGVDSITKIKTISKAELEKQLGLKFDKKSLLITYHPVTLEKNDSSAKNMENLLSSLEKLKSTTLIFTFPNSDNDSRKLIGLITDFVNQNPNAHLFVSLGQKLYFSCVKQVDGVIGNSSSGLLEVPTFKKGTINIGTRQNGRLKASSIIDCDVSSDKISTAINDLYSDRFQESLELTQNPYGKGGASKKIVSHIKSLDLPIDIKKIYFDIDITKGLQNI